ncbi:hypothetical protein BR93DRAFT_997870 [Coniochaeta sp. PMI_546]|nr:hypothetical protein BR93DRAFT_997870 [Coniochaeta sp. PMI_546]
MHMLLPCRYSWWLLPRQITRLRVNITMQHSMIVLVSWLPFLILSTGARPQSRCKANRRDFCNGTDFNATLRQNYTCGDPRLGPGKLPTKLPLDALTDIYDPLGGLCPGEFLAQWFNTTAGHYNYPPADGFALDVGGNPMKSSFILHPGVVVDRFGSEYGVFVAPAAAPYMQRALPPSSLDTPQSNPEFPYNYHVYIVRQSFTVIAGPIAPWYGQPGQGVQYKLNESVQTLVNAGVLKRVDPSYLLTEI